jgi:hypothetical protein
VNAQVGDVALINARDQALRAAADCGSPALMALRQRSFRDYNEVN